MINTIVNSVSAIIHTAVYIANLTAATLARMLDINYAVVSCFVDLISWLISPINTLITTVITVSKCLSEEFIIFCEEFGESIIDLLRSVNNFINLWILESTFNLFDLIRAIASSISSKLINITSNSCHVLSLTAKTVVDLIDLVLLSIFGFFQFIPTALYLIIIGLVNALNWTIATIIYSVTRLILNICLVLISPFSAVYQSIASVSLNSWLGLAIVLGAFWLCKKHSLVKFGVKLGKKIIYSASWTSVLVFKTFMCKISSFLVHLFGPHRRFDYAELENRMCIVCTEDEKCIALFPCRHVCLCVKCWDVIRRRNNSCPICRSDVERGVHVFL